MTPNPAPRPTNRNRFSLILQLASSGKPDGTPIAHATSPQPVSPSYPSPRMRTNAVPSHSRAPAAGGDAESGDTMKLLRKARKLSRALGGSVSHSKQDEGIPCVHEADSGSSQQKSPVPSAAASRSSSQTKRRKLTREPSKSSPPSVDLTRLKSILSPRPSIASPSRKNSEQSFTKNISEVLAETPKTPLLSPEHSTLSPRDAASIRTQSTYPPSVSADVPTQSPISAVSTLTADSEYVPDLTEQRRNRITKLTRHLGERVPSELIPRPIADAIHTSHTLGTQHAMPKDRATLGSKGKERRRKSLDLSAFSGSLRSPSSSPGLSFLEKDPSKDLKRSRSLWNSRNDSAADEMRDEESREWQNLADERPEEPISERQRYRNVRRARKMMQMFGTEPPPALFQITNMNISDINDEFDEHSLTPVERRSLSTLLSVSALDWRPASPDGQQPNASDSASIATIPAAEDSTETQDVPDSPAPFSTSIAIEPQSEASGRPSTYSHRSAPSQSSLAHSARPSVSSQPSSSHSPILMALASTETPADFHARRRRAQKLSRFFGVGYQDLSAIDVDVPERALSPDSAFYPSPVEEVPRMRPPPSPAEVDVKINGPSGFWGFVDGRHQMKEADPQDVMRRLRAL